MIEVWRAIPGFEGLYVASNLGRIRSLGRADKMGRRRPARILALTPSRFGYRLAMIFDLQGKRRQWFVHRLIAMAFELPHPEGATQVNHKNCDKADNRPENLEWVTPLENQRHAALMGLRPRGEDNPRAVMTEAEARRVIEMRDAGKRPPEIVRSTGIPRMRVAHVFYRRTWLHLQGENRKGMIS